MKRVTSPAWLSVVCISAILAGALGTASWHAAGSTAEPGSEGRESSGPGGDGGTSGPRLSVTPGRSESARISRPSDGGGPGTLTDRAITLSSYDAAAGRAVLSLGDRDGKKGGADVRKGDLITSPPTKTAPAGALVKVREVRSGDGPTTEVRTSRASLAEVFGGAKARGRIPVSPSAWKVHPLVEGLDVARGVAGGAAASGKAGREAGDKTGDRARDRSLRFDFDTELPMFKGKSGLKRETEVGGFLEMAPEVTFSYDGRGSDRPANATASIGVEGDYKTGWRIKGPVATPRIAPRIPLAEIAAYPVIMVGPVPVVVSLKLTLVLEVRADGRMKADIEQAQGGTMKIGTRYAEASGWKSDSHADGRRLPGGRAEVAGDGQLRTMLGPEASIGLYDTVGVDAFFGPYLRATARHPDAATESGDRKRGAWKLYRGVTLENSLFARLPFAIIGIRPSKRLVFPVHTREWPVAEGRVPARS
ncbi:hypothetical protein [Streptomyces winkii]|uniref:hypothetical protein n=1 Tax=Streptomyces winkii TaxID=3051178 RepID=UPI0028D7F2AC|nr:hypothetical protein [Streptomyces sp. DSM 40971]